MLQTIDREHLTQKIFNAPLERVEQAILNEQSITTTTFKAMSDELSIALGIGKVETLKFLGVSPSTKSRRETIHFEELDRGVMVIYLLSRVSKLIGANAAHSWLSSPKKALDGARPIDLIRTRVGQSRIEDVLGALEDGAYL